MQVDVDFVEIPSVERNEFHFFLRVKLDTYFSMSWNHVQRKEFVVVRGNGSVVEGKYVFPVYGEFHVVEGYWLTIFASFGFKSATVFSAILSIIPT